jgi:hypothetical protein
MWGFISGRDKRSVWSPKHPDWLLGPSSLILDTYLQLFLWSNVGGAQG